MHLPAILQKRTKSSIILVVGFLIALKAYLMTISPLSLDFLFALSRADTQSPPQGMAPYAFLIRGIIGIWAKLPVDHPHLATVLGACYIQASSGLYLLVFLLKLPLLILDIVTGMALYFFLRQTRPDRAFIGLLAWIINPYVTLINEMWAPIDLLPTFFMFLAVLLVALGNRKILSFLCLASSVALKFFPLLVLPAFIASRRDWKYRVEYLLTALVGVGLYLTWLIQAKYNPIVQLLRYDVFTQYLNFDIRASIAQQLTPGQAGIGFGQQTVGFGVVAVVIIAALILEKWPREARFAPDGALVLFLTFLAFTQWWPQYILWILPLLTLDFALRGRSISYLLIIITTALILGFIAFNTSFTCNSQVLFFIPAYASQQTILAFQQFSTDPLVTGFGLSLTRFIFSLTCLAYVFQVVDEETRLFSSIIGPHKWSEEAKAWLKSRLRNLSSKRNGSPDHET